MMNNLFAALPFNVQEEHLPFLLDHGLQPEIAFTGPELDRLDLVSLRHLGKRLADSGRRITVHAPFHDLNPGALDPAVRDVTVRRFRQTLAAADHLGARLIVFHPGYEKWKYGLRPQLWLDASLEFWPPFLELAAAQDCLLAVENIFEDTPQTLSDLVTALDSPWFGHCLDIGHWNLFAASDLEGWVSGFAPRLFHLHLHDNTGSADDHLPVGDGSIDFSHLFSLLGRYGAAPSMTMEAFSREHVLRSLQRVRTLLVP